MTARVVLDLLAMSGQGHVHWTVRFVMTAHVGLGDDRLPNNTITLQLLD